MKTNFHILLFERIECFFNAMFSLAKTGFVKSFVVNMGVNELMQCFKQGKNKLHYLLEILYLASIFNQLTSIYFWCALFIIFLIICSELQTPLDFNFQPRRKFYLKNLIIHQGSPDMKQFCELLALLFLEVYKTLVEGK